MPDLPVRLRPVRGASPEWTWACLACGAEGVGFDLPKLSSEASPCGMLHQFDTLRTTDPLLCMIGASAHSSALAILDQGGPKAPALASEQYRLMADKLRTVIGVLEEMSVLMRQGLAAPPCRAESDDV